MYIRKNGEIIHTNSKKQVEKFNFRPIEKYDSSTSSSSWKMPVWSIVILVILALCFLYMLCCYIMKRRKTEQQRFGFKFY